MGGAHRRRQGWKSGLIAYATGRDCVNGHSADVTAGGQFQAGPLRDLSHIPGSEEENGQPAPPTIWKSSALPHSQ